jgi:bifunctional non-homologous end joining protein LigD
VDGGLVYAGHTGGGFSRQSLAEMSRQLRRLERKTSPFTTTPRTNEKAHWTTPRVVVEVRFNEWTGDGSLRHPIFLGIRDDKDPKEVVREPGPVPQSSSKPPGSGRKPAADVSVDFTNRDKVFFPAVGRTKGDLIDYYTAMAGHILPAMSDRPLVLKRFPNGVDGKSFYQQSAPDDPPVGVRVEELDLGDDGPQRRLVGGNLDTLLYTIQLGAISYDPWHSRVGALDSADYTILDLDPGPGVAFSGVIEVARWVFEEMEALGLHGALKTSGSRGLHIYLPLPAGTPLDAATLVAQIVTTRVSIRHPEAATVERMRRKRSDRAVYVDYLQNILGKTVAGVYAVRAREGATVSTPLARDELTDDLDMRDFTMDTVPARVERLGDIWAEAMNEPNDLTTLIAGVS